MPIESGQITTIYIYPPHTATVANKGLDWDALTVVRGGVDPNYHS